MKNRLALSAALAAAITVIGTSVALAQDDAAPFALQPLSPSDFGAVSITNEVDGKHITEWIEKYDDWFWLPPMSEHPGVQGDCQLGQGGPVFFLSNVPMGMTQIFDCTIEADQHILVSPGGGFGFNTEPEETPESLYDLSIDNSASMWDPQLVLDGRPIPVGGSTWFQRDPFTLALVDDNLFGYPAGEVTATSNGWYLMLEPLEPGQHTIYISDQTLAPMIRPGELDAEAKAPLDADGQLALADPAGETIRASAVFNITVPDPAAATE